MVAVNPEDGRDDGVSGREEQERKNSLQDGEQHVLDLCLSAHEFVSVFRGGDEAVALFAMERVSEEDFVRFTQELTLPVAVLEEYINHVAATNELKPLPASQAYSYWRLADRTFLIAKILEGCDAAQASELADKYAATTIEAAVRAPNADSDALVLHAVQLANRFADLEHIYPMVNGYVVAREGTLTSPRSIKEIAAPAFERIVQLVTPTLAGLTERMQQLNRIAGVLNVHNRSPRSNEDRLAEWAVAKEIYDNTGEVAFIRNTLVQPQTAATICDDPTAKNAALALLQFDLEAQAAWEIAQNEPQRKEPPINSSLELAVLYDLSEMETFTAEQKSVLFQFALQKAEYDAAQILFERYHPDRTEAVKNVVAQQLVAGRLENVSYLQEHFGAEISQSDFDAVYAILSVKRLAALKPNSLKDAVELHMQMKVIDDFRQNGFSRHSAPQTVLPEGYMGKFLLVEFENQLYLRSGAEMHKEILKEFEEELVLRGFSKPIVEEKGGAHVYFRGDGSIYIHGSSNDFGTCSYKDAKKLIERLYPGRTVDY